VIGKTDNLNYGQSVTDACVDWSGTVRMVEQLAGAVETRRAAYSSVLAG
jgi:3-deoxy-7-phosphoheptulonate synthase